MKRRCIRGEQTQGGLAKWINRAGSWDGNCSHRIQHPVEEAGLVCTFCHEQREVLGTLQESLLPIRNRRQKRQQQQSGVCYYILQHRKPKKELTHILNPFFDEN